MTLTAKQPVRPAPKSTAATALTPLQRQQGKLYWPFLAPSLFIYLVLFVGPGLAGVYVSLTEWHGTGDEPVFIGLGNYGRLFGDGVFVTAFWNTMAVVGVCGLGIFILAFFFTALLREIGGKKLLRTVMFVPYIISPIAVAVALSLMLAPQGALNTILNSVGLNALALNWLSPEVLFKSIMVGIVWVTTGFYVMLLLSGVERIPPYLYEDAALAGVTQWQKFWQITVPLSWDILSVAAVLWVINSIRIFEFIWAFVGAAGSPPVEARTISIQQYLVTTGGRSPSYDMGYGAAMGVFMLVLIAVLVFLLRRIMRRDAIEF